MNGISTNSLRTPEAPSVNEAPRGCCDCLKELGASIVRAVLAFFRYIARGLCCGGDEDIRDLNREELQATVDRLKTLGKREIQKISSEQLIGGVPIGTLGELLAHGRGITNLELKVRFDYRTSKKEIANDFDREIPGEEAVFSGAIFSTRDELERNLELVKQDAMREFDRKLSEETLSGRIPPGRIEIDCQVTNEKTRLNAFVKTNIGWWDDYVASSNTRSRFLPAPTYALMHHVVTGERYLSDNTGMERR